MRRILVFLATMVMGVLLASGVALAAVVSEAEPNNSIAGAQAIADTSFDLTENADITQSTTALHATVNGGGNSSPESFDFYSFTVPAGASKEVALDIDHTTPDTFDVLTYDPWIELYDSLGNLLAVSDDASGDPGSTTDDPRGRDSFIYTTLAPGTYYVAVGRFACCTVVEGVERPLMGEVPNTATYQLHVSIGTDLTQPSVVDTSPDGEQTGVVPTANVTATFSEQVQGVTKSNFTLERVVVNKRGVEQFRKVRAQVSTQVCDGIVCAPAGVTMATLDPAKDLPNGVYLVTFLSGVTDVIGNPLLTESWRFTVGSPPA